MVDQEGRIFAVLAGRPQNDPSYEAACTNVTEAMLDAETKLQPVKPSRRGDYQHIHVGISHGGGQQVEVLATVLVFY